MSKWHKETNPVDRALADLDHKIASVERQLRDMGHDTGRKPESKAPAIPPVNPASSAKKFFREMLTPPAKRTIPARPVRRDLFDTGADPMKDLEAEPIAFAPAGAPDLFAAATVTGRPIVGVATGGEKLASLLAAGTVKMPKPTLKRVQRQTRNSFFMWLGMGVIVIILLLVWIRG